MSTVAAYTDLIGPRFFVSAANGSDFSDIAQDIIKFEYDEDEKKVTRLMLTLNNKNLKYVDDPRFVKGLTLNVRWGYAADLSDVFVAVITKARPKFPTSGVPTMEIAAYDLREGMDQTSHGKHWGIKNSSDIATEFAKLYNFATEIDFSNDARPRTQSKGESDFHYLAALASKLNWDFYLEGNVLHFHSRRYGNAPSLEFYYYADNRGTLLEFEPEVKFKKPDVVSVGSASTKNGKGDKKEATPGTKLAELAVIGTKQRQLNGSSPHIHAGFTGETVNVIQGSTNEHDPKIAGYIADANGGRIDMSAVKAKATFIGSPRLKSKQIVSLKGLGHVYSGNWRVAGTKHIIVPKGNIYTVQVELSRSALNGAGSNAGADSDKNKKNTNNKGPELVDIEKFNSQNNQKHVNSAFKGSRR